MSAIRILLRPALLARVLLPVCALALTIVPGCGTDEREYAVFQFVAGEVFILKNGSPQDRRRAFPGATAGPQDVIQTGPDSAAELQVREMGIVRLGENSRLKLGDLSSQGRLNIQMQKGRAGFLMKRLKPNSEFRVSTPTVIAAVRGTSFLVGVDSLESDPTRSSAEGAAGQSGGPVFAKVAMFDGALELAAPDAEDVASETPVPPTILDRPGEVRLKTGDRVSPTSIQPLSAESIAEMKALEEMTSPAGRARPDTDMIPPGRDGIVPRATPLPLPEQ